MRKFVFLLFCWFTSIVAFGAEPVFDVKLIPLIIDPELNFWFYTPPNTGPRIPITKTVYQNQTFMLFMPSRVTPVDQQKKVAITYDLKLMSSDGKLVLDEKDLKYYKGPLPGQKLLLPNDHIVDMAFDKTESPGKYRIEAVFYETVSKRTHKASVEIELLEFEKPKAFDSDEEISDWIMNYYRRPDPIRVFSAILYHVELSAEWIEDNGATLAFYRRIFQDNPFLWEYYAELYKTVSDIDKKKMLLAVSVIPFNEGKQVFLKKVTGQMREFYDKSSEIVLPETDRDITTALQLDILWSEFLASGTYKPVKRIVSALELKEYDGILEKIKNKEIANLTEEIEKKVMLEAVYHAAEWSLVSNCMQFHRVHQYCQTIYMQEKLDLEVKEALGVILAMVDIKKKEEAAADKNTLKQ